MNFFRRIFPLIQFNIFRPTERRIASNDLYLNTSRKSKLERKKTPSRTEIINYLLTTFDNETTYLEIGVRNPADNFNKINSNKKYSVDPGLEFKNNPVDFKMTSDEFFKALGNGDILSNEIRFDAIFIDGLHLADQVDKDIQNSLKFLNDDGFIVLHDCNPPTEWHAREGFHYIGSPAGVAWNGTTWKAFMKWRCEASIYSCCIDTDWGVGILSKSKMIGESTTSSNSFYEFQTMAEARKEKLNLISFENLKSLV